jgi:hypothetical protein
MFIVGTCLLAGEKEKKYSCYGGDIAGKGRSPLNICRQIKAVEYYIVIISLVLSLLIWIITNQPPR